MLNNIVSEQQLQKREELFLSLYQEAFPATAAYVSKMGGSLEEARDIFQDAVILYYEKLSRQPFQPENGEKAYLLGIAKHLWFKKYRKKSQDGSLDEADIAGLTTANDTVVVPEKVMQFLATAGKKCMEMLQAFYYNNLPMKEIASSFGFGSTRSATVQKYKCLEKVRSEIREKSMQYEDFLV